MQPSLRLPSSAFAAIGLAALAAAGDELAPTALVSANATGFAANDKSHEPAVSADGRYVAFTSYATDLVAGDVNGLPDVFVLDRQTGAIELISADQQGAPADGLSFQPTISADGRYVCFNSSAKNLVVPFTIGYFQFYVRDRQSGTTELVSKNALGAEANNTTEFGSISADGRYVAFASYADNLVVGDVFNGNRDIFVRDRVADTMTCVSRGPGGVAADSTCWLPTISGDGRFVAFRSQASNLVIGGTTPGRQHIYLYDSTTATLELMSADSMGVEADDASLECELSDDGQWLAFTTASTNLLPPPFSNDLDIVVRNLVTGAVERGNLDANGNPTTGNATVPSFSADGRHLCFISGSVAVPHQYGRLYVRDRQLGKTIAACSTDTGANPPIGGADAGVISADGTTVAMESHVLLATNDTNFVADVYVRGIGAPAGYGHAKLNSLGCLPTISSSGEARMSNGLALTVRCTNVINNKQGVLIMSLTGPKQSPFQGGILWLAAPFGRSQTILSGGTPPPADDCSGVWSVDLGAAIFGTPLGASVATGSVIYAQWWGRDPGYTPPQNVQLSDALQVHVAP